MDEPGRETTRSSGIRVDSDGHVRDIVVHGNVAGRDIVTNVAEDLTYDVSDLHANPFLGLASYTYATRAFYGGRERQVGEAVARLTAPGGEPVLLFVTGASGSGKSSFAQAGLVPALEEAYAHHHQTLRWSVLRPGRHPLEALDRALQGLVVAGFPAPAPRAPEDLNHLLDALRSPTHVNVLVVDQFEELFTQADPLEQAAFLGMLSGLDPFSRTRTYVLATLRADYLPALFHWPALLDRFKRDGIELREMSSDELARAIRQPLQEQARLDGKLKRLDPGLVDRLVADVGGDPTLLPLLQVTLRTLWDEPPHTLVLDRYRSLTHALQRQANRLLEQDRQGRRRSDAERAQMMSIFLDLVEVSLDDDPRRDVRRTLPKQDVLEGQPERSRLIDELADARLLATSVETQRGENVEVVDIIHESLLDNWPLLRATITAHREALQRRERFRLALRQWLQSNRDSAYLLHGVRLAEASSLVQANDIALRDPAARALVQASIEREQREQRRAARRRWAVTLALMAVVSIAALVSFVQRQDALAGWASAEQQRAVAEAERVRADEQTIVAREQARLAEERERASRLRELAAQSGAVQRQLPQRSLLLAIEAARGMVAAGLDMPSVREALRQAVASTGGAIVDTGDRKVSASTSSGTGRWLAFGFEDGDVWLVDLSAPEPTRSVRKLAGSGAPVDELAFPPGDQRLVVSMRNLATRDDEDRSLALYALPTGDPVPLRASSDAFSNAVISPDHRWLATIDRRFDQILGWIPAEGRLWDLTATVIAPVGVLNVPAEFARMDGVPGGPTLRFSPDSRWLVGVAKDDGAARLWEVGAAVAQQPTVLSDGVASVHEHQGHMYVVTHPTAGLRTRIWDVGASNPSADPVQPIRPLTSVDKIRISPDRRWLIIAEVDGVRVTDLTAGLTWGVIDGATADALNLSPDGSMLWVVSSNQLGYARLSTWWLGGSDPYPTRHDLGTLNEVPRVRGDLQVLAARDGNGVYRGWRLGREGTTTYSATDEAASAPDQLGFLLFLPGDSGIVTVDNGGIRIWPAPRGLAATETPRATLRGHEGSALDTTLSQDGRWLVTVGSDRTIRLWNLAQAVQTTAPAYDDVEGLVDLACLRAGRNFAATEWREIFGDEPYRTTCPTLSST